MDYSALNLNSVLGTGDEPPSEDTLKDQFIAVETSKPPEYNNLKLSKVVVDSIQQNQEKLTYEHSLVTNGGIFYPAPGEVAGVYAFSPFTQDPFRQSLGSIPILTKGGTISLARTTKSGYMWGLGASGAPHAIIETNKKYLLPKNYHNSLITNFEITEKTRQSDDNVPIYNFNDINQIKIYYGGGAGEESGHTGGTKGSVVGNPNIGGDNNQAQQKMKLNFLSLFFGVTQKMEGYTYNVTESNLSGILIFLSQASSLAYDAVLCGEYNNPLEALTPDVKPIETGSDVYGVAGSDWEGNSAQTAKVVSAISKEVLTNIENNEYYDHTFKMDAAISEETVPLFGEELGQNTAIADIKPNYNYFIKNYEDAKIPEVATYSVYNKPQAFANKLHLAGLKDINMFEYAKYGSAVTKGCIDLANLANSLNPRKNHIIVFDSESTILNNRADDLKDQVPFYNTVEFKADSNRAVSTMMRKHGIMDDFIKTLISYVYGADPAIQAGLETPADKSMNLLGLAYSGILIANKTQGFVSKLKDPASINFFPKEEETYTNFMKNYEYDFGKWLEYYIAGIKSESDSEVLQLSNQPLINKLTTFLVDEKSDMKNVEGQTKFGKTINMLMFLPKFKSFVEEKARTFEGMMGKTFCYSETLFYRVEKTDQDGNVVQNIFITKPEVSDVVKYIDSQVQYGKIYNYKIVANQLVIGSKYQYKFATNSPDIALLAKKDKSGPYQPYAGASIYTDQPTESQFSMYSKIKEIGGGATVPVDAKLSIFTSIMKPDVRIIEVPYHQESDVIVLDSPPMSPVVNFYPIHNKKNDMILSFETQTGNIEQEPISILDEDDAYFALERVQQKRDLSHEVNGEDVYVQPRLTFKSDDFSSEYQIFRISDKQPSSYSDFKNNLHQTLNVNERTSFVDKVGTNRKYYYTFRSKDQHGNISNPTPVYQLEMIEDSGVAYPVISIVDMAEPEKTYDWSKSLFRYLQIDASRLQTSLNEEKSGLEGKTAVNETVAPVLGSVESSLWNQKRFKIRVRSKNSGKMVDLNIAFKTRHTKPETIDLCD